MDDETPVPAVAVSPTDQSSDRMAADANQVINVEKLDQLITASGALGNAAEMIAHSTAAELAAATAQRARFMKVMAALAVITIVLLAALFGLGLQSAAQRHQIQNLISGKDITAASSVKQVGQVIVLAAVCAPSYVQLPIAARQKAIEACIIARLPKGNK